MFLRDKLYKYNRVTRPVVNQLRTIVGKGNVSIKKDEIEKFSLDESALPVPKKPEVIVRPLSAEAVSEILKLANLLHIAVTPRGAGTGVSGGCIPLFGGILLSLEQMNRIIEIDINNFTATVEPGVTLTQLNETLFPNDLSYPIHIGDMSATIGGSIATNAGGMNALKFGVTRHHVLGLEAVLPNGDIVNIGGKYVKCSTGYDLTQLMTGSEGTLAIITKITLKLIPRASSREILFIPFNNLQDAINTVPELMKMRMIPTGIEFLDNDVIRILEKHMQAEVPSHDAAAFLMIIMEANSYEEIIQYFSELEAICRAHGAIQFYAPTEERAKRKFIEMREKILPAIKRAGKTDLIDAVVPRSEIARFVVKVKEISRKYSIQVVTFGHAGDGNIHLHPLCVDMDCDEWTARLPYLTKEIYKACISFGGTISGEHGIGSARKKYLRMSFSPEQISLMKTIKLALDPNNILNPGKIFDI